MAEPTLEERVASLERAVHQISQDCSDVLTGQKEARARLEEVAAEQAQVLRSTGEAVTEKLLHQSEQILGVSASMIKLQSAVQRWAAAGTLAGSVVFYIIAKAAGL